MISLVEKTRYILFVDDEAAVLQGIRRSLHGVDVNWHLSFVGSVDAAIEHLSAKPVDVVVTDVTMPGRDGFDLVKSVAGTPEFSHIPVIVLTGLADAAMKRSALDMGAFDMIGKPVRREDLIARLRSTLRTKSYADSLADLNATLEQQVADRTRDLNASRNDLLICLAMAGECRDSDTGHHVIRVAHYARCLADELGMTAAEAETLFRVAPLHDIGKLGVPDNVLLKPGPLDAAEWVLMRAHCEIGHRILTSPATIAAAMNKVQTGPTQNPMLDAAAEIALYHHEKWNGSGYPRQLAGAAIPMPARIVAVADVYDALTTKRPYKLPMSHEQALAILRKDAGTHFDPQIVDAAIRVADEFDAIRQAWADDGGHGSNQVTALGALFEAPAVAA